MNPTLYMEEAKNEINKWHKESFPDLYPPTSYDRLHLIRELVLKSAEEAGEIVKSFNKRETQGKLAEEAMDTIVCCFQLITALDQNIEMTYDKVMEKNRSKLIKT